LVLKGFLIVLSFIEEEIISLDIYSDVNRYSRLPWCHFIFLAEPWRVTCNKESFVAGVCTSVFGMFWFGFNKYD